MMMGVCIHQFCAGMISESNNLLRMFNKFDTYTGYVAENNCFADLSVPFI